MDFGEVLGRAWQIIWKHKILWIFGIFAGCTQGGGGGGGGGNSRYNAPGNGPTSQFPQYEQYATQFVDWIASHLWVVGLAILVLIALIILSLWLGTMGHIGLIKGTFNADGGAERLAFGELWGESRPFFWRMLLLSLLAFVVFLAVLLPFIVLAIVFATVTLGLGLICLIPIICLLVPMAIAVGLLLQLAERAIVLENLGIVDSVGRGWDVFKRNIGPVLLIWLILAVIGFVAAILIALPLLIVFVPVIIFFVASRGQGAGLSWTPLAVAGLCFVAYLPLLIVLRGILVAYIQSAWTLTYMRLTRPKAIAETPAAPVPNA